MSEPTDTASSQPPAEPGPKRSAPGPLQFSTRDPEEAHEFLCATYVENSMRIRGSRHGFHMRHVHHQSDHFAVGTLSHSMSVEHQASPLGYVLVGRVLRGRFERETPEDTLFVGAGEVFLMAPRDQAYLARWDDVDLQMVRIDDSVLAEIGGGPDGRVPRLDDVRAASAPAARHLGATLDWITDHLLTNPDAAASPLVVGSATRALAAAILTACPHTPDVPATGDRADTPATLRRAVEFIESHSHLDIGLADIAAAAAVGQSAVRQAFRRHLHTTPGQYLRRVRLDQAHAELLAADPTLGDTVQSIATRWGFAHQSRFAAAYRRAFGVSPNHTLRH